MDADEFRSLLKGAKSGAESAIKLGNVYRDDDGREQDYGKALKWYRFAVEKGLPQGYNKLGNMYLDGWGVEEDQTEGLRFFEEGASLGNGPCAYNAGNSYLNGRGWNKALKRQ